MGSIFSGETDSVMGDWRKRETALESKLFIKYNSHVLDNENSETQSTANAQAYNITFSVSAQNLNSTEAYIFISKIGANPMGLAKVQINPNGQTTVVAPFYILNLDTFLDYTLLATIDCDNQKANTEVFSIKESTKIFDKKNDERRPVQELHPSSKFFLSLKEKEGLGYNIIKDNENEISKVLPYDDGGKMGKGFATIGWGHLIEKKPFDPNNSKHKKWKDGITLEQAEALLYKDVLGKSKLLASGLGDGKTKGIKVKLYQREYDALLLALYNGGYGSTLENTINKGVDKLKKEEIYRAFLTRRFSDNKESRGLIKRRAMEADIFLNDNWMPFPSDKFKNYNKYIEYFQKFLKTGILFFLLICFPVLCQNRTLSRIDYSNIKLKEYQDNTLLYDVNDTKLNKLDTTLNFSSSKFLFKVAIKHNNVTVTQYRWSELPDNKYMYKIKGYLRLGFIFMIHKNGEEELMYKIILNKGIFEWNGTNWTLYNSGDN